jgi:hypothetical protein
MPEHSQTKIESSSSSAQRDSLRNAPRKTVIPYFPNELWHWFVISYVTRGTKVPDNKNVVSHELANTQRDMFACATCNVGVEYLHPFAFFSPPFLGLVQQDLLCVLLTYLKYKRV